MQALDDASRRCPGTVSRRALLRFGLTGFSSLSLAGLLRLESLAAAGGSTAEGGAHGGSRRKSLIVLWLWGGPSHMDTFDLKPEAPAEYRGAFRPMPTNVAGIEICEHLPRLARLADRFALVRSLHHRSSGHVNSTHTLLTGYEGEAVESPPYRPRYPDIWSVTQKALGPYAGDLPAHVALPFMRYTGAAHLSGSLEPFAVAGDPSAAEFKVPNLAAEPGSAPRLRGRMGLLASLDRLRRDIDAAGSIAAMDEFQRRAIAIVTGGAARAAFDLEREDARLRDRYGRHPVGQRCLLARRLVEAGARIVTVDFPCVPGQKAFSWDDHASVWNIFEEMQARLPVLDQVVSALIEDLDARGMADDVLLAVLGEMSHTPRLSNHQGQPGREHWSRAMSVLLAGGGLRLGQVVGATDRKGEEPASRPVSPNDLLATWYRHLGVPLDLVFEDRAGRPIPILPHGEPIAELG